MAAAIYFMFIVSSGIFLAVYGTPMRECTVEFPENPRETDLTTISIEGCDVDSSDPCEFNREQLRRWMTWNITFDRDELVFLQDVGTSLQLTGDEKYDDPDHYFVGADIYHWDLDERDITKLAGKNYAKMLIRAGEVMSFNIVLVTDVTVDEGTSGTFQVRLNVKPYGRNFCVENDYIAISV